MSDLWQKMNIGLIPKESEIGLDGTTTKVTIIQGSNKLELEWWEKAPEPWRPVEKIIRKLRKIVKEARAFS